MTPLCGPAVHWIATHGSSKVRSISREITSLKFLFLDPVVSVHDFDHALVLWFTSVAVQLLSCLGPMLSTQLFLCFGRILSHFCQCLLLSNHVLVYLIQMITEIMWYFCNFVQLQMFRMCDPFVFPFSVLDKCHAFSRDLLQVDVHAKLSWLDEWGSSANSRPDVLAASRIKTTKGFFTKREPQAVKLFLLAIVIISLCLTTDVQNAAFSAQNLQKNNNKWVLFSEFYFWSCGNQNERRPVNSNKMHFTQKHFRLIWWFKLRRSMPCRQISPGKEWSHIFWREGRSNHTIREALLLGCPLRRHSMVSHFRFARKVTNGCSVLEHLKHGFRGFHSEKSNGKRKAFSFLPCWSTCSGPCRSQDRKRPSLRQWAHIALQLIALAHGRLTGGEVPPGRQ